LVSDIEIFCRLLIVGLSFGIFTGIIEWLILRSYLSHSSRWWILTSVCVWAIFPVGTYALSSLLLTPGVAFQSVLTGITLGLAQWFFLRRLVPRAGWWVLARGFSGFVSFFSISLHTFIESAVFRGLIVGAITSFALIYLLEWPAAKKIENT